MKLSFKELSFFDRNLNFSNYLIKGDSFLGPVFMTKTCLE